MTHFEKQIDAVGQLSAWANNPINVDLLGAHAFAVQKKLRNTNLVANKINNAVNLRPTLGIYGPSQAGKSYLTAKFAENKNGKLSVKMDKEYDFLREINPSGGRESTALVSRFSTEPTSNDKDFPVKAKLLSEAEIVCILANSYYCDNHEAEYPKDDRISEILQDCNVDSVNLNFENEQALLIEHYLEKKVFPKILKNQFASVWVAIADCYGRKPLDTRARIYSILWNEDESFSALFLKLATSLEILNNSEEVFLPISSLLPRESSIIDVKILGDLMNDDNQPLTVLSKGNKVEVQKSIISGLISELFLQIVEPKRTLFEKADLLDFPGARTRFEKSISNLHDQGINEFFLRGKIEFLFHKFTIDLAIDALVFCIDPGPMNIKELPRALEDWIDLNEFEDGGENAKLFFTLTKFDTHFPDAAGSAGSEEQRFENAIDSGLIQPFAQHENSWPMNWRGSKFSNVFPIRNPNYPLEGYFNYKNGIETAFIESRRARLNELKDGFNSSELVSNHIGNRGDKWSDLVSPNGGGVNYLAEKIEELDLIKLKNDNLIFQMRSNVDAISETLGMFLQSGSENERHEKELEKFKALWKSIHMIGQSGKFNSFIKTISASREITQSAIKNAVQNVDFDENNLPQVEPALEWMPDFLQSSSNENGDQSATFSEGQNRYGKVAEALLESWVDSITVGFDSIKIKQLLNTDMASFEFLTAHIAHEVQIKKIKAKLEEKFEQWSFEKTLDSNIAVFSKIANEIINSHVLLETDMDDPIEVVSKTISNFSTQKVPDTIEKWKLWINIFGKKIEENCYKGLNNEFDSSQNEVLSTALDQLRIA